MSVPPIIARHRSLRWLVPVGVLGVAGLAASGMFNASASSGTLPRTTPAALIAAVRAPVDTGFSGTVVSHVSLGLPDLPFLVGSSSDTASASMPSLLSGSHTLQVWYGGVGKQRIALLGATDETDLFRSGRQLWRWSSATRVAEHLVLPASTPQTRAGSQVSATPLQAATDLQTATPADVASAALAAMDPTTRVTVQRHQQVADRAAYDLILTPRTSQTRIGSVHIAIDGRTKVPLAVQVYPRGSSSPAIDISYSSIRFAQPPDTYFHFSPPSGATVHVVNLQPHSSASGTRSAASIAAGPAQHRLTVTGSGWTRVFAYDAGAKLKIATSAFGRQMTAVSGSWGHGRLLESSLLSVLITDRGLVYAGAVDPSELYAAAG